MAMKGASMEVHAIRLDLPIVLDGVADEGDPAVALLVARLAEMRGVNAVHILPANTLPASDGVHFDLSERSRISPSAALCVHFNPVHVSREEITRLALQAGSDPLR